MGDDSNTFSLFDELFSVRGIIEGPGSCEVSYVCFEVLSNTLGFSDSLFLCITESKLGHVVFEFGFFCCSKFGEFGLSGL